MGFLVGSPLSRTYQQPNEINQAVVAGLKIHNVGSLSSDNNEDNENVIAFIWTCSILSNVHEVPWLKKTKENSSSYVHVLHKTSY